MNYLNHKSEQKGFTIIELLVAISIIITAATAVVAILTASLRGSSKVNALEDVRQSGSNAVFQITKIVQFAEVFEGVSRESEEGPFYNNCYAQGEEVKDPTYLKVLYKGESKIISCTNLSINGQTLINNSRIKLSEASCHLTCQQTSIVDPPVIGISFTLEQRLVTKEQGNLPEKGASLQFSTTIKMRNLNE